MGGGKGGSETTTIELPEEIREASKINLAIADEVAALGYAPYSGPTIAGFAPQAINAFQNVNQAANAFGMANVQLDPGMSNAQIGEALTGMPAPQQFGGGFSGYSGASLYNQALSAMPPAQRAAYESFFMNPYTGAPPTNPAVPQPQFQAPGTNANWWESVPTGGVVVGGQNKSYTPVSVESPGQSQK